MDAGTVAIEIDAIPVVTYAMAHNGIQVINAVRVVNRGDELRGATLRAELRDSQGRLSKPFTELLDLPVEAALVLRDLTLALDPAAMATVEAHRPGRLKVEILDEDDWAVGSAEVDVIVHAAQHWSALPIGLGLEMLSAHVMPNSPEVAQVLRTASGILEARTGSPSIEGYQADVERVDDIVRAVYEALQGLGIAYANPPASWHGRVEDAGQKVRSPREVVGERVGTCLDLTVVMAACLEQAGIRPLLWVIEGHAFLGWWRDERALGSIVVTAQRLKLDATRAATLVGVAIVAFFVLGLRSGPVTDPSLIYVFLAGAIAICAMILPGISGSFLLLMLGLYDTVLGAVSDRDLAIIVVFGLGAVLGLAGFSTVLHWALHHHHQLVLAGLVGLMLGSLRVLWPWPNGTDGNDMTMPSGDVWVPILFAVIGGVAVVAMSMLAGEEHHDEELDAESEASTVAR